MNEIQTIEEKIKAEFEKLKEKLHAMFIGGAGVSEAGSHADLAAAIDEAHANVKDAVAPVADVIEPVDETANGGVEPQKSDNA